MHHKVIVIDREVVILGSYNFSKSANTRNDENCLIIHSPALAETFLQEFHRLSQ
jgi:phosphatidylserine/phosphatidylglycerophosphate/cardiolipin synthase-like enzyme